MTLEEFLKLPFTNDFHLLNHIADIQKIPVEYVSILEPPVEKFVRSNEIVLSTALSVRDTPEELYQFIYDLYSSGAAAVVFAFPNDTYEQLKSQLPLFEKLNFPILSMSWEHLFSDVVENTLKEIWAQENENQSYLESMQRELLNHYIQGKTFDDAAELLYKYLASDILILAPNQNIKGRNRNIQQLSERDTHILSEELNRIEIAANGHLYGYILVDETTFSTILHSSAAKQCISTPLALWFDREFSITASKMKAKEDVVWKLAHHEFTTPQDAISKAELSGFSTQVTYACFAANVFPHNPFLSQKNDYSTSYIFQSSGTIIEEQVLETAHSMGLAVMTVLHEQRLIIFLETSETSLSSDMAESYLDTFETNIKHSIPSLHFFWGYDNLGRSISTLYEGYKNAKNALHLCMNSHGTITRSCFQFSILQKATSLLCSNAEITAMAKDILQNLFIYDKEKGTDLIETLRIYCESNYNISESARALHLHRQSLLYRLEKIENLCHLSLKKHEDLFVLELSILVCQNADYNHPFT